MGQVIIPLTPTVNPAEVADNSDWNETIESNRFPDGQFDLEGDYPRSGPGQQAGNGGYVNTSNLHDHFKVLFNLTRSLCAKSI